MNIKHAKLGIIATSIFMFSSIANAETISVNPLATESYSKEFNVSTEEAERRLTITSQSEYIAQKINEQFGDSIRSMYFDNGQEFKLIVRTTKKGNTEKQVIDISDKISKRYLLPIEVEANSSGNFEDIQNIISAQKAIILEKYDSFQMIGYNPQEDAIHISFFEPDLNKQNEIKASLSEISGMNTSIKFLNQPITNASSPAGGGEMFYSNFTTKCSAGFTGTMNGKLGILTATHCVIDTDDDSTTKGQFKNLAYYKNSNSRGGGVAYTFGKAFVPESIYHEIAFLPLITTSISGKVQTSIDPKYYTSFQTITGIGSARAGIYQPNRTNIGGTRVCHIGNTTGYSCGTVYSIMSGIGNAGCNSSILGKITSKAACAQTKILVGGPDFEVVGGDSGGPLFDSTGKAYGITSATGGTTDGIGYGIFSSLQYLSNFELKTGG